MRIRSDKPTRNGGWLHRLSLLTEIYTPSRLARRPQITERASVEHCHLVYSALLHRLDLSISHQQALRARGLTPQAIEQNGYRTAPAPEQAKVATSALQSLDLRGVPGFYMERDQWRIARMSPGFLIPVRDIEGRIRALQLRRDEGRDGLARYLWLSSSKHEGGASSGAPIHFARADLLKSVSEVIITEGALKADVTSCLLGSPVIAASGVTTFGSDFAHVLRRALPQLETIILAFDMDWQHNEHVRAALFCLMDQLDHMRFTVRLRTWPAGLGKGIDDYLLAISRRAQS